MNGMLVMRRSGLYSLLNIQICFFSAMLLFTAGKLEAQKSDVGAWYVYLGNQALSKKWNWWNEVQYRNYNMGGDLQQLLLRTGLGFNLTENNNNVLLGYAYIISENYEAGGQYKLSNHENRIYQQFLTKQQFGRLYLQHRYRIEERFLEDKFRMRFRYGLSVNIPITAQTMAKGTVYFVASDELFIHGDSPAFDRNRLYGGIGYVISSNLRCEAGLIRQTLENSYRDQIQVVVNNTLPIYK
jgi:hypothetical protein